MLTEAQECITSRSLRQELSPEVRGDTMVERHEDEWRGKKEWNENLLWPSLRKIKDAGIGRGDRRRQSWRLHAEGVGTEAFKKE